MPRGVWVRVPPPAPRQKNSAPFRFRGLRKSRENCTSAESFFRSQIEPASLGFDLDSGSDIDPSGATEKGIRKDALFCLSAFGGHRSDSLNLWEEKTNSVKDANFFDKDLPIKIVKIKIENNEYYMIVNSLNQCHILPIVMREEQNENKK